MTVAPGDSLWRIATRLRPGASAAETAALVHRLHRVNRAVIGADPDRLRPGQQLHLSASHRPDQPQESR